MKKVFLILVAAITLVGCSNGNFDMSDLDDYPFYDIRVENLDWVSNSDTTYICFHIDHTYFVNDQAYVEWCQVDSVEVRFRNPEDSSIVSSYKAPFRLKDENLVYTFPGTTFTLDDMRNSYDWVAVPNNVLDPGIYLLELKAPHCKMQSGFYPDCEVTGQNIRFTHIERRHVIVD